MTDVEYIGPETGILQQTFPAQSAVHQHDGHCDNCDNCDTGEVRWRKDLVAEGGFDAAPVMWLKDLQSRDAAGFNDTPGF